jgi:AraC-like DNA-binding protein
MMKAEKTPEQMVDALNATFGRHTRQRASHAKGIFGAGAFVPNPEAIAFSNSQAFSPSSHPATVLFSIAGGNPKIADKAPAKAVEKLRVEAARLMMEQGRHSMDVIADETGFADRERMRRAFLRTLGQPPQTVRRAARSAA